MLRETGRLSEGRASPLQVSSLGPRPSQPSPAPPRPTLAGAALAAADGWQHHGLRVAVGTAQVQDPHRVLGVQAVAAAVALALQVRLLREGVAELGRGHSSLPEPPPFALLAFPSGVWPGPNTPGQAGQRGREGMCRHQAPVSPKKPTSFTVSPSHLSAHLHGKKAFNCSSLLPGSRGEIRPYPKGLAYHPLGQI